MRKIYPKVGRNHWQQTAVQGAVSLALASASGWALAGGCGSTTATNSNTGLSASGGLTIPSSVTVSTTAGGAVTYTGDLTCPLVNNGSIAALGNTAAGANTGVDLNGHDISGTLTNNGVIHVTSSPQVESGNAVAIGIKDNGASGLTGTVTNAGSIQTTATGYVNYAVQSVGVYVANGTGASSSITNQSGGQIVVNAQANTNVNSALASGPDAAGIWVGGPLSGSISNAGSLTVSLQNASTGGLSAVGIDVGSSSSAGAGTVSNSGSINVSASGTGNLNGTLAAGIYTLGAFTGTINNTGTVTVTAPSVGQGFGIFSKGGTVQNAGTITVTGGQTVYGVQNQQAGNFSNTGTINVSGASYSNYGIQLQSIGAATAVSNSGSITASSSLYGSYGASLSGDGTGTFTNSGTITGLGTSTVNGRSVFSSRVNINNTASGQLVGDLSVTNANVSNAGLVDLPLYAGVAIAMVAPTGYSGMVNTGNYTQTGTGTLRLAVNSASNGGYAQLKVTGAANLGGTLAVNVLNSGNNLAVGSTLYGVVQANTINGTFSQVTSSSPLFKFTDQYYYTAQGSYTTPRVDLVVQRGLTVTQSVNDNGNNPAVGAAQTLDTIIGQNTPGMQGVINGLAQLTSEQGVSNAAGQTLPLLVGGSLQAANDALSGINRVIQSRLEGNNGLSSGDAFLADRHMWVKPFGSWTNQHDDGATPGFSAKTAGLALGGDGWLSDKTRAGLAFAYANSSVTGNSATAPQNASVKLYQLIGYGSYSLDDRTDVNFQVDVGNNDNGGSRSIPFMGVVASSQYNSSSAHVGVGIGRTYPIDERTTVVPSLRADYTWIKDAGYTETGAGALNLNVDGRSSVQLILGVDAKVMRKLDDDTTLTANAGLGYDTMNRQSSVTATYAGAPGLSFVTYGINQSPWLLRGGVGVVHKASNGLEVTARYDMEYRAGFNNQTASVKMRWAF